MLSSIRKQTGLGRFLCLQHRARPGRRNNSCLYFFLNNVNKSVANAGSDTPGESHRLPHPSVHEAAGERVPVHHSGHQTGTILGAFTLHSRHLSALLPGRVNQPTRPPSSCSLPLPFPSKGRPCCLRTGATLSSCQHGHHRGFHVRPPAPALPAHAH